MSKARTLANTVSTGGSLETPDAIPASDISGLSTVATSGSYNDLSNKPTTIATANDLSGGVTGAVPYQAGVGDTAMLSPGTSGQVLTSGGSGAAPTWSTLSAGFTLGTPITTTSGTIAEFTGIPAGVRQIIVSLNQVSFTTGTGLFAQLGTAGSYFTSGYLSCGTQVESGTIYEINNTTRISLSTTYSQTGSSAYSGQLILTLLNSSSNLWAFSSSIGVDIGGGGGMAVQGGSITLSANITRIKLYGGTFDNGSINIMYI